MQANKSNVSFCHLGSAKIHSQIGESFAEALIGVR
jgi:hypothetical protein